MRDIRIIEVPPGEAPARIRAAWVGVTIPLADIPQPQPSIWATTGVLGKDRGLVARFKRFLGILVVEQPYVAYVVDATAAIESLRTKSPSAAAWWERYTPHLLAPGNKLCFAAACCEEITRNAA